MSPTPQSEVSKFGGVPVEDEVSQFGGTPAPQDPTKDWISVPSPVSSFAGRLGQNIWGIAKGTAGALGYLPAAAAGNPVAQQYMEQNILQPMREQRQQAGQAYRGEGEFATMNPIERGYSAFGHGLAGVLPFGPPLAKTGEELGESLATGENWPQTAADLTTVVGGAVAPELMRRVGSRIPIPSQGAAVGADPKTLTWKALKPAPRAGFEEHFNTADYMMGQFRRAAAQRNWTINNARELKAAIDAYMQDDRDAFWQHWDQATNPRMGPIQPPTRIPLDHIGDLIDGVISPRDRLFASGANPNAEAAARVQAVHDYANQFRGRTVSPDEFRELQQEVNADRDIFERKTDPQKATLIGQRGGDASLDAEAHGYQNITRQVAGDPAAERQYWYGKANDWRIAALKAIDTAATQKTGTALGDAAKTIAGPGKVGKIAFGSETPPENIPLAGPIDTQIKWAFDKVKPGPPLPLPAQLPTMAPVANIFQGTGRYATSRQLPAPKYPGQGPLPQPTPPAPQPWQVQPNVPVERPSAGPYTPPAEAMPSPTQRQVQSIFGSQRGSFSNRPKQPPAETPNLEEPLAKRMGKTIWNAVRPKVVPPEQQDIDWQMRYGEKEQPEVARFLGYDNPEPPPAASRAAGSSVTDQIRQTYARLASHPEDVISTAALQRELPNIPRDQFDKGLLNMRNEFDFARGSWAGMGKPDPSAVIDPTRTTVSGSSAILGIAGRRK